MIVNTWLTTMLFWRNQSLSRKYRPWLVGMGVVVAIAVLAAGGYFAFRRYIMPFSSRYNQSVDTTNPNGVDDYNAPAEGTEAAPSAYAVNLRLMNPRAVAGAGFDSGVVMELALVDKQGKRVVPQSALSVTLSTSSASGSFDQALAQLLPSTPSVTIRYRDTIAGTPTITGFVSGLVAGSVQPVIAAGAAVGVTDISTATDATRVGETQQFRITATDTFGNVASGAAIMWQVYDSQSGNVVVPEQSIASDPGGRSTLVFTPSAEQANKNLVVKARLGGSVKALTVTPQS